MSINQSIKPVSVEEKENLTIGGCDLVDLAKRYGTPLYVIDEATLRGICRDYTVVDGYNSMITDLCPTHVFEVQRDIDNKINDDISDVKTIESFCIGCNHLCDAKYSYIDYSIKDISSPKGKKYGICDYGRKLDYYSKVLF